MTPQEFEAGLQRLGMSQGQAAKKLGVRPETVNRWLRGIKGKLRDEIPGAPAAAMEAWLAEHDRKYGPPLKTPERSMA